LYSLLFSQQTPLDQLNTVNWLIFVMHVDSVLCEVGTGIFLCDTEVFQFHSSSN